MAALGPTSHGRHPVPGAATHPSLVLCVPGTRQVIMMQLWVRAWAGPVDPALWSEEELKRNGEGEGDGIQLDCRFVQLGGKVSQGEKTGPDEQGLLSRAPVEQGPSQGPQGNRESGQSENRVARGGTPRTTYPPRGSESPRGVTPWRERRLIPPRRPDAAVSESAIRHEKQEARYHKCAYESTCL
ncbi:hypothetical protein SKAU_G00286510 [Synaphobranchus kaupii]|uniref:Uncharacterized protein n=1 Tax=Synaphobranchus kaupii TaxID=118154 RepID=A0A9Q1EY77_SYNKA|nr:hypothetical protein SKAU_G00286510 [Synaphobranchus kaupii]